MTTNLRLQFHRSPTAIRLATSVGIAADSSSAGRDSTGRDSAGRDSAGRDSAGRDSTGRDSTVAAAPSVPPKTSEESVVGKQLLALCQQINSGVNQLTNQNETLRLQLQTAAIELAVAATEAVLNKSMADGSVQVDGIIRQFVKELDGETSITVFLNPGDHANLLMQVKSTELAGVLSNLKLVAVDDVPSGTCRAANSMNTLRTDLLTRLATIRERWMESLNVARTGHRSADAIS